MPAKQTEKPSAKSEEDSDLGSALMIIVIAVGVLVIIILAYCARLLYIHVNVEQFKLEALKAQAAKAKKAGQEIEIDNLGEQYNAANDYGIFGVGDKRGGGMQTLQEKMNLADVSEKRDEGDSSSDSDPYNENGDPSMRVMDGDAEPNATVNFANSVTAMAHQVRTNAVVADLPEDNELMQEPESEK